MKTLLAITRREDVWTAETVQYGVALRSVIGLDEAKRYLISRCVPLHVVERVLSVAGIPRRLPRARELAQLAPADDLAQSQDA